MAEGRPPHTHYPPPTHPLTYELPPFDGIGANEYVVDAVHGDAAVEGVVHRAVADVAPVHGADQVEVDRVAAKAERLSRLSHFDVFDAADEGFVGVIWGISRFISLILKHIVTTKISSLPQFGS